MFGIHTFTLGHFPAPGNLASAVAITAFAQFRPCYAPGTIPSTALISTAAMPRGIITFQPMFMS
jgi:hypothetical protein